MKKNEEEIVLKRHLKAIKKYYKEDKKTSLPVSKKDMLLLELDWFTYRELYEMENDLLRDVFWSFVRKARVLLELD
jgi:hypothetical protein